MATELEKDADAFETTGATLLVLKVVGLAAKLPPSTTVDSGVPFSSTQRVTGTFLVTQSVSVTTSWVACLAPTRGLAQAKAARAAKTMVLLIGAILTLVCAGLE